MEIAAGVLIHAWMDQFARGRRSLTEKWRLILIGREYNREKKPVGKPKGSKKISYQPDNLKTHESIAADKGVSPIAVVRAGQRAKVYDAVEAKYGRDSDEANPGAAPPPGALRVARRPAPPTE